MEPSPRACHPCLRHQSGADRGAVLRRWRARTLGHPLGPAHPESCGRACRSGFASSSRASTARIACPSRDALWMSGTATRQASTRASRIATFDTSGERWLRGFQRTDASGLASFLTIYPGWYCGRAVHIHFKIRTDPDAPSGLELTSQLFFDDDMSRSVYTLPPYVVKGAQDVPNARGHDLPAGRRAAPAGAHPDGRRIRRRRPHRRAGGLSQGSPAHA